MRGTSGEAATSAWESRPLTRDGYSYFLEPTSKPMNITTTKGELAMSSRDIAARTGKQHYNVIRDIEAMFEELGVSRRTFASGYQDANNQTRKEYLLDKELTSTLVTGYSVKLRNAVIARWQELEVAQVQPQPLTQIEVAKSYLAALEANEALELASRCCSWRIPVNDVQLQRILPSNDLSKGVGKNRGVVTGITKRDRCGWDQGRRDRGGRDASVHNPGDQSYCVGNAGKGGQRITWAKQDGIERIPCGPKKNR